MTVKTFISSILLAVFLLAGCTRLGDSPDGPGNDRETVPVPIYLAVAPTEEGTPGTKVDYEPDTWGDGGAANAIKTFTILQFEKDNDDPADHGYTRVGNQICYGWPLQAGENIALVTSPRQNIIFVIANATAPGEQTIPLSGSVSLADFLKSENASLLSSMDALDGTGIWYSPDGTGANRYLRMSATKVVNQVVLGTKLGESGDPLVLKRNCAKVTVKVKNSSPAGEDKITIESVRLRSVNKKYYYVTNVPDGLSVSFDDTYSPANPSRFDFDEETFPVEKNTDGTTQTYTWLVPVNMRGENTAITAQGNKNRHAPQGATYFSVYASYGSPAKHITFSYYLGANLITDYNLEANKKYEYTIDIKETADPDDDSRVEDRNDIVFRQDANCYMLQPPSRTGKSTIYSIPVRRAAVFWNSPGSNMGVYGAGVDDAAVDNLTESTTWEARLVWNDITDATDSPVPDNELLVGASGIGFNPASANSSPYVKIKVQSGMKGNALVAIKKTGASDDATLWSWHIWVTDYDPYVEMAPIADTYLYSVPNGEIHRYADKVGQTVWTSGDYANGFIMDRHLGAVAATVADAVDVSKTYGLYYQYGRKDPFRTNNDPVYISGVDTGQTGADGATKQNIRYSVHRPETFIGGGNWTSYESEGTVLGHPLAVWHDSKATLHGTDYCEPDKSIYDPCPYGWMVPKNAIWYDFNATITTIWQGGSLPHGRWYYPGGDANNGRIWYPSSGGRSRGSGKIGGACGTRETWCNVWSASYQNADYPYRYMHNGNDVCGTSAADWYAQNYIRRADAFTIRCIRVANLLPY